MIDCPNGMMRDRLPDLLHGRLDAAERAEVEAHVRGCAECDAELALLAELRGVLRMAPAVDTAAIVAALPAAPSHATARVTHGRWSHWRAAAAIALVAGGTSLVVMQSSRVAQVATRTSTVSAVPNAKNASGAAQLPPVALPARGAETAAAPAAVEPAPRREAGAAVGAPRRELAVGVASVGDLSDKELSALLSDMESLDATPSLEVEGGTPVTPVSPGKDGV